MTKTAAEQDLSEELASFSRLTLLDLCWGTRFGTDEDDGE